MAKKEQWEMNPWDDAAVMERVIGKNFLDIAETKEQSDLLFSGARGACCLEIGAGYGRLMPEARKYNQWCTGVESSVSLTALSTRFLRNDLNSRVVLTDGLTFPFQGNIFDFVYSLTCFQHMEEIETIRQNLREMYRVLRFGSKFCVQTVYGDRDEPGRYDGYVFKSAEEFSDELVNVGFRSVTGFLHGEWIWARGMKP